MRPVGIADIELAARVLICVPPHARKRVMSELLLQADLADRYRKRLGRIHPEFGSGTLMSAAQKRPQAMRFDHTGNEILDALSCVINALLQRHQHHET